MRKATSARVARGCAREVEQVAAHRPLPGAIVRVVYHGQPPGPIPPIPRARIAVTGQRLRDPWHAVLVGEETIGTEGQMLLCAKLEQPATHTQAKASGTSR